MRLQSIKKRWGKKKFLDSQYNGFTDPTDYPSVPISEGEDYFLLYLISDRRFKNGWKRTISWLISVFKSGSLTGAYRQYGAMIASVFS